MVPSILFVIFNRPEKTRSVFSTIRAVKPSRLYVAADGPRNKTEAELCLQTRAIIDEVDWPCEVHTLFREENLGCGKAVSQAISWFFENEPEGVIIEDDILVDPSFFDFAGEMLERYRDEPRVMTVSACNFLPPELSPKCSYYFSAFSHIWGWGSWRRAWRYYDFSMMNLESPKTVDAISNMCPFPGATRYWMEIFHSVRNGKVDTWDYQWLLSQWHQSGLTICPRVNMMQNIGFDETATHTKNSGGWEASLRAKPLHQPYIHPTELQRYIEGDKYEALSILRIKPERLNRKILRWLRD